MAAPVLDLDRLDQPADCASTGVDHADARRRYRAVIGRRGATAALIDGAIDLPGFAIEQIERPNLPAAFGEMVRDGAFDICEMALATYLSARAHGRAFTAIPVFPFRALHYGAILVNRHAGITDPRALAGRTVGIARGYTATTGVWARGILQDDHGVDPASVTWLVEGKEHVAEYRLPRFAQPLAGDRSLSEMLASGEIDAAIGVAAGHPDIVPLFPDAYAHGLRALATDGFYPINHLVVVRDECLAADPALAPALFRAFAESRQRHFAAVADGRVVPDRLTADILALGRDPLPYGIEPNRAMLERMIRHAATQQVIAAPIAIEPLFAAGTRTLTTDQAPFDD